ncbi:MAG: class I SAM-dependent methyltransferase [Syntrophorhabdaceae bacterium]
MTGWGIFHILVKAIRRIYSFTFLYFKWFFLKAVSAIGHRFVADREIFEYWLIRFGNRLFSQTYPYDVFDNYDSYVDSLPDDLAVYTQMISPGEWLIGKTILDLGSGLGQYSHLLKEGGAELVIGLEYQSDKALFARHKFSAIPNVVFITGDAHNLPLASHSVDSIFSHTVFEHLSDIPEVLQELRRVLCEQGKVILSFNFFHSQGGHHLFPYVHFPWPTWVVSEKVLCDFWSKTLDAEQRKGAAMFYPQRHRISSLSEGSEIQLNKMTFDEFEQMVQKSEFKITARFYSNPLVRLFPVLLWLPRLRYFLAETIFYVLEPAGMGRDKSSMK